MKGYIFDLDGTLVDSMWVWEDLAAVYLQTKGIKAEENLSKELQLLLRELNELRVLPREVYVEYRRTIADSEAAWHEAKEQDDY